MDKETKVDVGIMRCEDCDKFNKAINIYNGFSWRERTGLMSFDKETNEILIDESGLMRIIQMVNPIQPPRKIRLINRGSEI